MVRQRASNALKITYHCGRTACVLLLSVFQTLAARCRTRLPVRGALWTLREALTTTETAASSLTGSKERGPEEYPRGELRPREVDAPSSYPTAVKIP